MRCKRFLSIRTKSTIMAWALVRQPEFVLSPRQSYQTNAWRQRNTPTIMKLLDELTRRASKGPEKNSWHHEIPIIGLNPCRKIRGPLIIASTPSDLHRRFRLDKHTAQLLKFYMRGRADFTFINIFRVYFKTDSAWIRQSSNTRQ